ncbi:MAG: helix-turn-helix domain-containing protein [Cohaesibacter sp.]|nr:helix-turn-helix domain-containing protein [Cohaesibacter sp.]
MTDLLPSTQFCVSSLPKKERFSIWRESISCIFQVEPTEKTLDQGFEASIDGYMYGQLFFARTKSKQQIWNRTALEIANDGMDHFMFQIFGNGDMRFEQSNDRKRIGLNGIIIFDLSREVSSVTENFLNISLVIPRDLLEPHLLHPDDHHMRILSLDEPMAQLLYDHISSLNTIIKDMTISQASETNPASIALAAAAMNASPVGESHSAGTPSLAQSIMAKRAIENNLDNSELTPDMLSRMVGISRSKLYSIFEREGGVGAYVKERRLRKAMAMLLRAEASSGSIMEIAYGLGFRNNSTFSRAFKQRYGQTPRDIRQSKSHANYDAMIPASLDRRYESWLKDLSI